MGRSPSLEGCQQGGASFFLAWIVVSSMALMAKGFYVMAKSEAGAALETALVSGLGPGTILLVQQVMEEFGQNDYDAGYTLLGILAGVIVMGIGAYKA